MYMPACRKALSQKMHYSDWCSFLLVGELEMQLLWHVHPQPHVMFSFAHGSLQQ